MYSLLLRFLGNLSYLKMQSLNYNEAIFNSAEITHARTQKDLKQKDISIEKLGISKFCKYLIISFAVSCINIVYVYLSLIYYFQKLNLLWNLNLLKKLLALLGAKG